MCVNSASFPSLREARFKEGWLRLSEISADGVVLEAQTLSNHPVCAIKGGSEYFLDAHPPLLNRAARRGKTLSFPTCRIRAFLCKARSEEGGVHVIDFQLRPLMQRSPFKGGV